VVEDPDDDRVLECAMEARSECIVTRDKDLLRLMRYEGIEIIPPEALLLRLRSSTESAG
jgi:predicted nucleic acid-binding protein